MIIQILQNEPINLNELYEKCKGEDLKKELQFVENVNFYEGVANDLFKDDELSKFYSNKGKIKWTMKFMHYVAELYVRKYVLKKEFMNLDLPKTYYPINMYLEKESYQRTLNGVKLQIIDKSIDYVSYSAMSNNSSFSPSFIGKVVRETEFLLEDTRDPIEAKEITISTDDIYLQKSKSKKSPFRTFVIYDGRKKLHETQEEKPPKRIRYSLTNRTVGMFRSKKPNETDEQYKENLIQYVAKLSYIYVNVEKVRIVGDGAGNITSLENELWFLADDVKRVIDKLHYKMNWKQLIPHGVKGLFNFKHFISSANKELAIKYLQKQMAKINWNIHKWSFSNNDALIYLLDWFDLAKITYENDIQSCVEGIQAAYFAKTFKRGRLFRSALKVYWFRVCSGRSWFLAPEHNVIN